MKGRDTPQLRDHVHVTTADATVSHTVTPAGMCDLGHRKPEEK
ncbi:hypothetical protein [Streptomyces sp. SID685]|nr:hypothetical protein [Streptomyces sp. SID685]